MADSLKKFNILIIAGFFAILYQPPILSFNIIHLVGACSLTYLFFKQRMTVVSKETAILIGHFLVIFFWLFMTISINGKHLSQAAYPVYFIIDVIPFTCALALYSKDKNKDNNDLLNLFVFVALIQAILSVLALCIPSIQKAFVDAMVNYGFEESYHEMASYRIYGLSSGITFATPIIQAVAAVICITTSSLKIVFRIPAFLVLAVSAIINARVSLVVFFLGAIVYILSSNITFRSKVKYLFGILIIVFIFINVILPYLMREYPVTYVWLSNGINDIISLFGGERVRYSYFDYVSDANRFTLPSNIVELLFGTGSIVMGSNNLGFSSDVGYINDIWLGGIFYILINYSLYIRIIRKISLREGYFKFLGAFFAVLCIVLNIKGSIMSNNAFTFLLIIIYLFNEKRTPKSKSNRRETIKT